MMISAIALAALATTYAASCVAEVRGLHDWLYPGALWRVDEPHVVLTFDDGPHPERTPRLLDALARADARATFFLLGERAARWPDIVRRIAAEGHQIGNHSTTHPWLPGCGRARIEAEIDRCQDVIGEITGCAPRWVRPPYGQRDFRFYRALRRRDLTAVLWSRNLRDYHPVGAATLTRRLHKARPGEIVLLHDADPMAPHTVDAVVAWLAAEHAPLGLLPE